MTPTEERVVRDAKKVVENRPEVKVPSLEFKRDWAFGNAGLEDERITRKQVEETIKE